MNKLIFIFSILFSLNFTFSQSIDLCGIWFGNNYTCYELNPETGQMTLVYLTEVIEIQTIGDTTYATKITGDNCVTAGQITWKGVISDSQSIILVTVGSLENPNSSTVESSILFVDSSHLEIPFTGLNFQKANCYQLDSLINNGIISHYSCIDCEILIPNVFSPNGDHVNDNFVFNIGDKLSLVDFKLLNRWGEVVYKSNNQVVNWDGTSNGADCSEGVYFWRLFYNFNNETQTKVGFLTLVR